MLPVHEFATPPSDFYRHHRRCSLRSIWAQRPSFKVGSAAPRSAGMVPALSASLRRSGGAAVDARSLAVGNDERRPWARGALFLSGSGRERGAGPSGRALGLDQPAEKRLRRSGAANPWSLEDARLFMALWLDNVSAASMAEAFGRSRRSIHGKRRWLGLGVRDRKWLADRSVQECRGTDLPWKPDFDVSAILARLTRPRPGKGWFVPRLSRSRLRLPVRSSGSSAGTRKRTGVLDSRLRGLAIAGDRRAHVRRVRGASHRSPSTIVFLVSRSFATPGHDGRIRRRRSSVGPRRR